VESGVVHARLAAGAAHGGLVPCKREALVRLAGATWNCLALLAACTEDDHPLLHQQCCPKSHWPHWPNYPPVKGQRVAYLRPPSVIWTVPLCLQGSGGTKLACVMGL
jgi:hypothetical protein